MISISYKDENVQSVVAGDLELLGLFEQMGQEVEVLAFYLFGDEFGLVVFDGSEDESDEMFFSV